ncbi:MAG: fumarylacetoacetate hydrolase family protein [Hyphomicrobiales bacterium]|nr:fumarylacetoacetate hydrolase family protein [Hyphomicrobiales bacterium]
MQLVSFVHGGVERLGFVVGEHVLDPLGASGDAALFADAVTFMRSGAKGMAAARTLLSNPGKDALLPRANLTLAAPLRPSTILCSGSNYVDHNAEKAAAPISGKEPEFFIKTADCVVGPDEPIVLDPAVTHKLDCETELAIVIGKPGRHIPVERALEHVFGYTIVNDVTARDRQVRKSAEGTVWYDLGRGKAFDSSAPLGPCITTTDEIPDPQKLDLRTRINGELRQSSNTSRMIWSCAELIYFFSINFTLRPGMVIITGTPAGTAWSGDRELGGKGITQPGLAPATRYCMPGDLIECEMEGIGTLRNRVVAAQGSAEYGADRKLHRTTAE